MTNGSPSPGRDPTIEARRHGGNLKSWVVLPQGEFTGLRRHARCNQLLLTDVAQALLNNVIRLQHPVVTAADLVGTMHSIHRLQWTT